MLTNKFKMDLSICAVKKKIQGTVVSKEGYGVILMGK